MVGRDIGKIPECKNLRRRRRCARSFRKFCETYGKPTFALAWGEHHLVELARIDEVTIDGGLFAMADPRGDGKTKRCEWAAVWALLNGHRNFAVLVGATSDDAVDRLDAIKTIIESNDLLLEDYPEVCFPIRALEGITARAAGQLCEGKQTHIEWGAKQIVLPTIDGSKASGAIVKIAGITGRVRGLNFTRRDGTAVRPDFVIIDDPQTDESAKSLTQCRARESILAGAILGLAGPGKDISGFMPCTVIEPDDMADRILDPERHPEWNGVRNKMVKSWPKRQDLWDKYTEMRKDAQRRKVKPTEANAFYKSNRAAMDEGAEVSWPARKMPSDLSALQHAMNIVCDRGRAVFFSEYQNDPLPREDAPRAEISVDDILARINGVPRGTVPAWATKLTAFVDVQDASLYWVVCAWGDDFTGAVVDYGAWPDQGRAYFAHRDVTRTLQKAYPQATGPEGRWYSGLDALADHILKPEWLREDGATLRIAQMLIDANYGKSTETVRKWCRETVHGAVAMPSHGTYVGARKVPFTQYHRRPGERLGLNWLVKRGTRAVVPHVMWDTNWWKTFFVSRMVASKGDRGALTLFGRDSDTHRMFAEHCTAESATLVKANEREVQEWVGLPGRDNHLFDCIVGCHVAASMQGVALVVGTGAPQPQAKPIRLSDIQRRNRQ